MSQLAIVAIPTQEDSVWRFSSEKIPHLTLLMLGDPASASVDRIAKYLEHVANTSMFRFGVDVDHRGVLGPDETDVLFFGQHSIDRLKAVRSYLLANTDIELAFRSVEQFPEWIPHLTMGTPSSPAKPDNRDFPGISWVNFDRVALWTGNFEGPTFRLKDNSALGEVGMSDLAAAGADFLAHHGVKGMRWGVRHTPGGGTVGSPTADAQAADQSKKKISVGGTHALTTQELRTLVDRMNLEQQYSRLVASQPTALDRGHNQVKQMLALANTGVQIFNLANSAAAKAGFGLIKAAVSKG